ncbi:hypothetical protein OTK49_03535 [Vibrio coralliirubri]|uniref:hypothetical protein n=1 Tax=Vibrio coralliirubri TaxID=1516159 RepID=UPI002283AB0F|nr:hypothetical protein [Vibrio coralliirubri]MCY9861590.1 hypothetical protein [Vibrio coralliirubri]
MITKHSKEHLKKKSPLYRKVNTKARGVHHHFGEKYKHTRGTKQGGTPKMKQGVMRGLDYTPLYKFLLSKVGQPYSQVHSEAVSRLINSEPISRMVIDDLDEDSGYFRAGESSYYSTLYVDSGGNLQIVDTSVNENTLSPTCQCCTHTFNGKVFNKKFKL